MAEGAGGKAQQLRVHTHCSFREPQLSSQHPDWVVLTACDLTPGEILYLVGTCTHLQIFPYIYIHN